MGTTEQRLAGVRVAVLATDGVEQVELTSPVEALVNAGAQVTLVSIKEGSIQGFHHHDRGDSFPVDMTIAKADASEFDALLLPGGVINPDALRLNAAAVKFVRDFVHGEKPVAAICHGPWMLAEADVLDGRHVTSYRSIKTDLQNAGAQWSDEACVVDGTMVTSRSPEDLTMFNARMIEVLGDSARSESQRSEA